MIIVPTIEIYRLKFCVSCLWKYQLCNYGRHILNLTLVLRQMLHLCVYFLLIFTVYIYIYMYTYVYMYYKYGCGPRNTTWPAAVCTPGLDCLSPASVTAGSRFPSQARGQGSTGYAFPPSTPAFVCQCHDTNAASPMLYSYKLSANRCR